MSRSLAVLGQRRDELGLSGGEAWISFAPPPSRPQVKLFRGAVKLFVDPDETFPTARFVKYEGDYEVI
jgi:hypothetical protein